MRKEDKRWNASPAVVNESMGEMLVMNSTDDTFLILHRQDFETHQNEDEIKCELLDELEIADEVIFTRFNPKKYVGVKKKYLVLKVKD